MGADLKRKEARKRMFQGQNYVSPTDAGVNASLEGISPDLPSRFESNQTSPPPVSLRNNITAGKFTAGKLAVADRSTNWGRDESATQKPQRFIVFIGNLPYTATDGSISKHFAKIKPKSIRHQKEKDTGKSKGFAFLEFEGYDRMKTCLKLYHQSEFEDEGSPTRKLNVELTAGGGGGKSKDRKSKLQGKNQRLNEQRKRRNHEQGRQGKLFSKDYPPTRAPDNNSNIHPSRRSRVTTEQYNSYA